MSKSFGSQQFEARGLATGIQGFVAGEFAVVEIVANARGGIVIERIDAFVEDVFDTPQPILGLRFAPPLTTYDTGPTADVNFQTGGSPVTSVVRHGATMTAATTAVVHTKDGHVTFENIEWFVASGQAFTIRTELALVDMNCVIQWRELPQAPGGP